MDEDDSPKTPVFEKTVVSLAYKLDVTFEDDSTKSVMYNLKIVGPNFFLAIHHSLH